MTTYTVSISLKFDTNQHIAQCNVIEFLNAMINKACTIQNASVCSTSVSLGIPSFNGTPEAPPTPPPARALPPSVNSYLIEHLPRLYVRHFNMPSQPAFRGVDGYELTIEPEYGSTPAAREAFRSAIGGNAVLFRRKVAGAKWSVRMLVEDYKNIMDELHLPIRPT